MPEASKENSKPSNCQNNHSILNELPRSRANEVSNRNIHFFAASSVLLNSFIPLRFAIGIIPFGHEVVRSTYKFQCTPLPEIMNSFIQAGFLKFEFHE
jgi:hypothetical protein